jgi:hypothetical protein
MPNIGLALYMNEIRDQVHALEPTAKVDVSSFTSFGDDIKKMARKEPFYNAVVMTNYKFAIDMIALKETGPDLIVDDDTYKAGLKTIYFEAYDDVYTDDAAFRPQEGGNPSPFEHHKMKAYEHIFSSWDDLGFHYTLPTMQVNKALEDETQFTAFMSGQILALTNKMTDIKNTLKRTAIATAIARVFRDGTESQKINVLGAYNDATNAGLTIASCKKNLDFLIFLAMTISDTKTYMMDARVDYNEEGAVIGAEDVKVVLLKEWDSLIKYNMRSKVYHEELVATGDYSTVNFWQSAKTPSSINIVIDPVTDEVPEPEAVELDNVIGILYEEKAIRGTLVWEQQAEIFNPKSLTREVYNHYSRGQYIKPYMPKVILYNAEG